MPKGRTAQPSVLSMAEQDFFSNLKIEEESLLAATVTGIVNPARSDDGSRLAVQLKGDGGRRAGSEISYLP